ncbi:Acg family FMN-binding oxidoreductase [Halomicrococcus gelatinilyticus]|uniref:Acg family FMN-binding oxidoreductase n=1 Tax=Halomicrococcus gelatinilyticus TaxID=1702103 RepID=UPI002E0E1491
MGEHGTTAAWEVDAGEFPADGDFAERARFLLRYATLAPSSHNSQPWAFEIGDGAVRLFADESRRLSVADPDGRELHLSLGCALENLVVAARYFGYDPAVDYGDGADDPVATVTLGREGPGPTDAATPPDAATPDPAVGDAALFDAIRRRRTNHELFDEGRPVPAAVLDRFRGYAAESDGDVTLTLVEDADRRRELAALQAEADRRQFEDPDYREELGYWVGSGALGANWLVARVGQLAVEHLDLGDREGAKNSKLLRSAPAVAVLSTATDDRESRVEAGRAFERLALAATNEGLAVHPMSQTLERPAYRAKLAELLGSSDASPQHLFRLGYGEPESGRTPRRPVDDVLR